MPHVIHTKLHLNAFFCLAVWASHNTCIIYQDIKSLVFCNKSDKLCKLSVQLNVHITNIMSCDMVPELSIRLQCSLFVQSSNTWFKLWQHEHTVYHRINNSQNILIPVLQASQHDHIWRTGRTAPHFPSLGTICSCSGHIILRRSVPGTHWIKGCVQPKESMDMVPYSKALPLLGIKTHHAVFS